MFLLSLVTPTLTCNTHINVSAACFILTLFKENLFYNRDFFFGMIQAKFCSSQSRFYDREIDAADQSDNPAAPPTKRWWGWGKQNKGGRESNMMLNSSAAGCPRHVRGRVQQSTKTCFYTVTPL